MSKRFIAYLERYHDDSRITIQYPIVRSNDMAEDVLYLLGERFPAYSVPAILQPDVLDYYIMLKELGYYNGEEKRMNKSMIYTLVTVNLPASEVQVDKIWTHMPDLIEFANENHQGWTSLVVTVLPDRSGW